MGRGFAPTCATTDGEHGPIAAAYESVTIACGEY